MRVDVPSASFLSDHRREVAAVVTVLVTFVVARIVDRAFVARGARALRGTELSPIARTRLRLVRRIVFAVILLIGLALALSQFEGVRRLATGILASSAVLGIVVGFAARQTLANAVAGVLLAITQPIRIGDLVTFEDSTGTVEDVRLTYTYIALGDGRRLIVPNERLAQSPIENHTIVDPRVNVEADVWVAPDVDVERALAALTGEEGVDASVAEIERDGVRLSVSTWVESADKRGPEATRLRAWALRRLRSEGISSPHPPQA